MIEENQRTSFYFSINTGSLFPLKTREDLNTFCYLIIVTVIFMSEYTGKARFEKDASGKLHMYPIRKDGTWKPRGYDGNVDSTTRKPDLFTSVVGEDGSVEIDKLHRESNDIEYGDAVLFKIIKVYKKS